MINFYKNVDGELKLSNDDKDIYWIELINPTDSEIMDLSSRYDFDKKYITDIKDDEEIARVKGLDDDSEKDLFMLSYPKKISEGVYITKIMSIILTKDVLITAIEDEVKLLNKFHLTKNRRVDILKSKENLILEIIWSISQEFIFAVKDLNKQIDNLENLIKKSSKTEEFYKIINLQKSIIDFELSIDNNGHVISEVRNSNSIFLSDLSMDMLFDMDIEYMQAKNMIQKAYRTLDQLSDLYSAVISNNLNDVMKILTSITIIMTVPTIIGGYWGMNVRLPISESFYSFYYLVGLSIIISILIFYWLKKKDYL